MSVKRLPTPEKYANNPLGMYDNVQRLVRALDRAEKDGTLDMLKRYYVSPVLVEQVVGAVYHLFAESYLAPED